MGMWILSGSPAASLARTMASSFSLTASFTGQGE